MADLPTEILSRMGFTALEAEIYVFLLQRDAVTGYAVAKGIGKPTSNSYKALESLEAKGAIEIEHGETRHCRAVPADELLRRLERGFSADCRELSRSLSALETSVGDDRIYRLKALPQVLERAASMLAGARRLVVCDVAPKLVPEIADGIRGAVDRGARVVAKVYEAVDLPGVELVLRTDSRHIVESSIGDFLTISADGEEHLTALVDGDHGEVHRAYWTRSPVLVRELYARMVYEFALTELTLGVQAELPPAELSAIVERYRPLHSNSSPENLAQVNLRRHVLGDSHVQE